MTFVTHLPRTRSWFYVGRCHRLCVAYQWGNMHWATVRCNILTGKYIEGNFLIIWGQQSTIHDSQYSRFMPMCMSSDERSWCDWSMSMSLSQWDMWCAPRRSSPWRSTPWSSSPWCTPGTTPCTGMSMCGQRSAPAVNNSRSPAADRCPWRSDIHNWTNSSICWSGQSQHDYSNDELI